MNYTKNIEILRKVQPELASRVEKVTLTGRYKLVEAKSGDYCIQVISSDGSIFLNSQYDPKKEAQRLVDSYEFRAISDLVFSGFGLGYHVFNLLERENKHGIIIILEHDIELFRTSLEVIDLAKLFSLGQIVFLVDHGPVALFNLLTNHSLSVLANSISVLECPAIIKLYPDYYFQIPQTVSDFYTWAKVNANTQMAKAETFSGNILKNIPEVLSNPGISALADKFRDFPAFIVSAGPSLDKNIHYLREVKSNGLIIAVDSAVKALLDNGIRPDFLISIDFGENNIKYMRDIDTEDLVLVFDPEVYPEIPKEFKGKKFSTSLPGKAICDWLDTHVVEKGQVYKGLSVSHTAFLTAIFLKASPVIFVGQDLSYPRNAWHSKGSNMFQKIDISKDLHKKIVDVNGYFGGKVKSEVSFSVFLNHFEKLFNDVEIPCYNATEGGALLKGTTNISLKEAIFRFCRKSIDKKEIIQKAQIVDRESDRDKFLKAAERVVTKLTNCNHVSYKAFEIIEGMSEEINNLNLDKQHFMSMYGKVVESIKGLDEDKEVLDILKDNAFDALLVRARREEVSLDGFDLSNREKIAKEIRKEKVFFTSLLKGTDFLAREFGNAIKELNPANVVV